MPGAILGQFYLLSSSLKICRRGGKKKKKGRGMVERKKKKDRGRQTEKWERKEIGLLFFF